MSLRILAGVLAMLMISGCNAEPEQASGADDQAGANVKARVQAAFPGIEVTEVNPGPVAGMHEVLLNGVETVYVAGEGRYLFSGTVYELRDTGPVDLSDLRYEAIRKSGIGKLDKEAMITFPAQNEKVELYVFTDVSCGYCRRMHQQMSQYNELGMTIHYLAFPRGGLDNPVAQTMRAVWCANDRVSAITEAKLSGASATPPDNCQDPVASQYELGRQFGVRGTPAVFTEDGEQLGGYVPPEELAKRLKLK